MSCRRFETGSPGPPRSIPGTSGAVLAPPGTVVALRARSLIPVEQADLLLEDTAGQVLERLRNGDLRLVEIQAFPSVFAYQAALCDAYREAFDLRDGLGCFLSELTEEMYWKLLAKTIKGNHEGRQVVLTEIDPEHQKTRPDFELTAQRLGIPVVARHRLQRWLTARAFLVIPSHRVRCWRSSEPTSDRRSSPTCRPVVTAKLPVR